jgi:hypothetical protein
VRIAPDSRIVVSVVALKMRDSLDLFDMFDMFDMGLTSRSDACTGY